MSSNTPARGPLPPLLRLTRSPWPSRAGIDDTMMLFGDAKKMTEEVVRAME